MDFTWPFLNYSASDKCYSQNVCVEECIPQKSSLHIEHSVTSGDSTGPSEGVIARGCLWIILIEVIPLLIMALIVAAFAYSSWSDSGNHFISAFHYI